MERAAFDVGSRFGDVDDHLVVACGERESDVGLCLCGTQGRRFVGILESVSGFAGCHVVASEVFGRAFGDNLVLVVQTFGFERIVCHESVFFAGESDFAAFLEQVGGEGGVPESYIVDGALEEAVVGVFSGCALRAACTDDEAVGSGLSDVRSTGRECAFAVDVYRSVSCAQDVECDVVPCVVQERCLSGFVVGAERGKLELAGAVHPEFNLSAMEDFGLAGLCSGTHPQFYCAVVGCQRRYGCRDDVEV